jgi:hypothetical protein
MYASTITDTIIATIAADTVIAADTIISTDTIIAADTIIAGDSIRTVIAHGYYHSCARIL